MKTAMVVYHGEQNPAESFTRESFATHSTCGYVLEKKWQLIPIKLFTDTHGISPQEAGFFLETLEDDVGAKVTGILLADDRELSIRLPTSPQPFWLTSAKVPTLRLFPNMGARRLL